MLRRLLGTGIIWLVFSLSIFGAVLVGYRQPPANILENFRLMDCSAPCWAGMTPGTNTADETAERLEANFGLTSLSERVSPVRGGGWFTYYFTLPLGEADAGVPAKFDYSENILREIVLPIPQAGSRLDLNMPALGDVVLHYGSPSCLEPDWSDLSSWVLIYERPAGGFEVVLNSADHLRWTQPVAYFRFHEVANRCQNHTPKPLPWSGLMNFTDYIALTAVIQ